MTRVQSPSTGTLYVVGTPIGNLGDLSPRAREVLCAVEIVAAEDTRRTRGLLSSIGAQSAIIAYHEHNEDRRSAQLLQRLRRGGDVALVSDAGMPMISDPGWTLVTAALAEGIEVHSVPGPSAALAALTVSGLPVDRFVFEGFLPRRSNQRAERLRRLAGEARTVIFFESVHRLGDTLDALIEQLGAARRAAIARELTKVHESVYHGTLGDLRQRLGAQIPLLGEFVIVVAGAHSDASPDEQEIRRVFALLCNELGADRAVELTAAIAGVPRNAVYKLTRVRA
jgi:16S rRNA (cytidine1402-2'-O)-methyltransferase